MSPLPQEAAKLLAVEPDTFVVARDRLVRKLRSEDRRDEASAVADLRKPTAVVFAVNRAARDRPKAAARAIEAARQVKEAQVGKQPEAFKQAVRELEAELDLLAEVAVAHVARRGKSASATMRRRVRDLLRSAVADDDERESLVRGALTEELEAVGFSSYVGMEPTPARRARRESWRSQAEEREQKRREHEQALREQLEQAERQLEAAGKAVQEAERERKAAERAIAAIRTKLDRIA